MDVSSTSTAEQSFSRLAHSCQIGDDQEAFTKWLATRTEHWLLVLDNADNRSLDISPYFPTGARGTIIITTRNPLHDLYKTVGGGSARVDKMDSDEATTLLLKASDTDGNDQSFRSRAQPLIQLLGYLPLAIIPAGALIRQGKYTPEEYCEAFAHRRKELLSSQSLQASTDYNYTVYTTWEVSITAIKESARGEAGVSQSDSADAANALELLNVFAFCHHDDISEEILQEAWDFVPHVWNNHWWMSNIIRILRENRSPTWDPLPFRQAIDLLSNYSLIYLTNRRIALHPLVQSCIRDRLDDKSNPDDGSVLQWWTTTLIMLALAAKTKDEGVVQRQRLLGPHIDTCLKTRDIGDFLVEDDSAAERVDVVHRFITYDSRGVVLEDRLLLAQRALGYCDKMLDENDPRLWQFLDSTACLANDMGRWQTTVDLLETKVTTYLDTHTSDSEYPRESLQAMERLIIAYNRGCRTQEALELAEKVLKVCSDSPGDHVLIASYIEEILAAIYNDLGRKEDAQRTAQIACSKMEAVLGENNPRCVRSKGRLADQYIRTGDSQKAIDMYQQVRNFLTHRPYFVRCDKKLCALQSCFLRYASTSYHTRSTIALMRPIHITLKMAPSRSQKGNTKLNMCDRY